MAGVGTGGGEGGGRPYFPGADAGRVAAALSICLLHVVSWVWFLNGRSLPALLLALRDLAIWGMPFFVALAGFFHRRAGPRAATGAWLAARWRRLLPLFLLWSLVYGFVDVVQIHQPLDLHQLRLDLTLGDTAAHLWFLPVLLVCISVVWLADRLLSSRGLSRPVLWGVALAGAGVYLVLSALPATRGWTVGYLYRTAALWLVVYVAGWEAGGDAGRARPAVRRACLAGIAAGAVLLVASRFPASPALTPLYYAGAVLAGTCGAVLACGRPGPRTPTLDRLGRATLGFYLLHFLVLEEFLHFVRYAQWTQGVWSYVALAFGVTATLTGAIVLTARRWRVGRAVLG